MLLNLFPSVLVLMNTEFSFAVLCNKVALPLSPNNIIILRSNGEIVLTDVSPVISNAVEEDELCSIDIISCNP